MLLVTLSAAAACSESFTSDDCKESRTCVDEVRGEAGQGGQGGEPETPVPATPDGEGGGGGGGGALEVPPECVEDAACSNNDFTDGVETCVANECQPGNPPPRVVSIMPAAKTKDVEPNTPIVIEFSEALEPTSVTLETVEVLAAGVPLAGDLTYEGSVATFTPALPLPLGASLEVTVSEEVTDVAGEALLEPFSSTFSVRDGSWHELEIPGAFTSLAPESPLTPSGSVLLGWTGTSAGSCPVYAAWLELESNAPASRTLSKSGTSSCSPAEVSVGVSDVGAVFWGEDVSNYVGQYRSGAWENQPLQATLTGQTWVAAAAVSPLGIVSRFELTLRAGGLVAQSTNSSGAWQGRPDDVLTSSVYIQKGPQFAFDAEGNGILTLAAFDRSADRLQVMASQYSAAAGRWEQAKVIPGSVREPAGEYDDWGTPSVQVTPGGDAMAVWAEGPYPGRLMGSYFTPEDGWSEAELAGSTVKVSQTDDDQVGLTFDGERFIAAWLGEPDDGVRRVFTASYAPGEGWSSPVGHDAKRTLPLFAQPQIVSDRHGSSLLVWGTGEAGTYPLVRRRFLAGSWDSIALVPGEPQTGADLKRFSLFMNESGVAALTWPVEGNVAIHVSRFY
jgi:Bacterial Ig-like domain